MSCNISPVIDYVIAAEFDIDKGSGVSFQYPKPTGCDESKLAEWMLPEGAHLHNQDSSWFFLNSQTVHKVSKPSNSSSKL